MEKLKIVKELLKKIHAGEDVNEIIEKYKDVLKKISPHEIPVIEQELVREGVEINEILKLCDLHIALFKNFLKELNKKTLREGHPLHVLLSENDEIIKTSNEIIGKIEEKSLDDIKDMLERLYRLLRYHYKKNQMLLFPYLEKIGIIAVPRVLWGREDKIIQEIRRMLEGNVDVEKLKKIIFEIKDLVFRENSILYPTSLKLLGDEEWKAVKKELYENFLNKKVEGKGKYPYEFEIMEIPEDIPIKFVPKIDEYELIREEDLDLNTGFLSKKELINILSSLPVEITFADKHDRIRFYSKSRYFHGFLRARTILGRKIEYCHPPRLEKIIREVIERLRKGEKDLEEFWTRYEGRIFRVLIIAVRDDNNDYLGALEVVEDFTEVLEKADEVRKRVLVI